MFLADYHTHTVFSDDAKNTMEEMAVSAVKHGLNEICFTDHVEDCCKNDPIGFEIGDFSAVREAYEKSFFEARKKLGDKINLKLGVEISAINHEPQLAQEIAGIDSLDFVIGSVHNLRGMDDFYFYDYKSQVECENLLEKYLIENIEVAELGYCDIIGHIGYACKYMYEKGFKADVMDYPEHLHKLFKTVVEKGLGIEVNTSGLRKSMKCRIPHFEVLKMYRQCGGEIITVGSDAHNVEDIGADIFETYEMLREAGFKYIAVYNKRSPKFINL